MTFKDRKIQSLKPKNKRYDLREKNGEGFAIRVSTKGEKSWIYFYMFEGRKRRMTLGNYPALSLADAKKRHREAIKILENGKDPAFEKQKEMIESRDSSTVNGLIEEYLEIWAKPRKRSWEEDQRILYKDIRPKWGKLKAKNITKRDVVLLLESITKRGAPIAANRTLACIRRMFNFGIERDLIPASPCATVKAPSKENRRERFLSMDEIKIFWHKLNNAPMSDLTKLALKFQLVTAQRKGEIVSAEWSEMDFTTNVWTIPAEKAKNGKSHRVPLSKLAIELLKEIMAHTQPPSFDILSATAAPARYSTGSEDFSISATTRSDPLLPPLLSSGWLFPAAKITAKSTHMTGAAIDHALRRSRKVFANIENFSPHTLRATATSHMASMRISGEVLSRILNHAKKGVTEQHYNKYDYDDEKRNALEAWSKKLKEIIFGETQINNIVALKNAV